MTTPATPDPKQTPRTDAQHHEIVKWAASYPDDTVEHKIAKMLAHPGSMLAHARQLERELAAAEQALAALRADKARLDWLEKGQHHIMPVCTWGGKTSFPGCLDIPHDGVVWTTEFNTEHPTCRDAIDAAMQPLPAAPALEGGA